MPTRRFRWLLRAAVVLGCSLGLLAALIAQSVQLVQAALAACTGAGGGLPADERVGTALTALVSLAAATGWTGWCLTLLGTAAAHARATRWTAGWRTGWSGGGVARRRPDASRVSPPTVRLPWRRAAAVALGLTTLGAATSVAAADGVAGSGQRCPAGAVAEVTVRCDGSGSASATALPLDGLPLPDLPEVTSPPRSLDALVRVRPGDSLWSLAAEHLGPAAPDPAVDRLWRRWYAANRAVVGPEPDLLLPGQLLRPPDIQPPRRRTSP